MSENTNNILEMDLDEASAKYLQESLDSWKEGMMAQFLEEVEALKQSTIEELEEENIAYKQSLKEEYADKFITALSEMREEIKAEVIAETVQNNPEIKVLEKIKEIIAPVISEEYREKEYGDSIAVLKAKIDELEEEKELQEGARTLASLIAPLSESTQNLVLSLIKEGSPEEVEDQFNNILESLESVFGEADDEDEDDEDDDEDEDGDDEDDDDDDDADDDEDGDDDDEDDDDADKKGKKGKKGDAGVTAESYIQTGLSGLNEEVVASKNSTKNSILGRI
jgi:hypothetical protein